VSTIAIATETVSISTTEAVAREALAGLCATPKTLSPWLFYDEAGSHLFEQITELPEYYLTRTERGIFAANAEEILREAAASHDPHPAGKLTLIELGAGTATKTGILLAAAVRQQGSVVYQPVDVSETALAEASENILKNIPGVTVRCQVTDYTREGLPLDRLPNTRTLALYIGSSIGNFTPEDAREVLRNLRAQLLPGDTLLLGTDLAPIRGPGGHKTVATLLAAYDDAAGVTAQFNRNVLAVINRELDADFDVDAFRHVASWNSEEERMEMWLRADRAQRVRIGALDLTVEFAAGEQLLTEVSCKFRTEAVAAELAHAGLRRTRWWTDEAGDFGLSLSVK